jgi:hypothetical protein
VAGIDIGSRSIELVLLQDGQVVHWDLLPKGIFHGLVVGVQGRFHQHNGGQAAGHVHDLTGFFRGEGAA